MGSAQIGVKISFKGRQPNKESATKPLCRYVSPATALQTADGSEVILPNGTIISNKVTNWTFSDRYRAVEVPVSVARGVAPQRVVELLKSVAANHPSVAKEPAPQAYVVNFAPGAVSFQLRAWTDRYEDWVQVRSDLSLAVDRALTRENIMIA